MDRFARLVREALRDVPESFRTYLEEVAIDVEAMPDAQVCREMGVDDPTELLGLYEGRPLTQRSVNDDMHLPDRVIIYQRNIERLCATESEIIEEIRTTVLHEIGHHFGLDEDDLEELGYD